ncbi:uncharacterized protein BT62DRAFT_997967 [Guyanagaster necrorhizus]|uniref:F-box domain-containing protein n=1 Tax=Guyanagaster necrorhizus TaxID=856835 RepID=A0A9P7VFN4_9AGAR|nr:uncharacterized protein BT62DRAFT_997967 [Guyanagaster necrorhizus MCA 3950]KAG7440068.1 hypothetical protein BT62DRAFT_997967 [Guyanagaster necrorhizus MCA 3950]
MDIDPIYLSEDEPSLRKTKRISHGNSWPPLTHFDQMWTQYNRWEYKEYKEISEGGGVTSIVDDEIFRLVRLRAFFNSLKGFYTGRSDLTGRFRARFDFLYARWEKLRVDLDALAATAEPYQDEWIDFLEQKHEYTNYKMTDEELWKQFQQKWLLPSEADYADIMRMAGSGPKIAHDAEPKFQKLLIDHLPDELLDAIYKHMDITDSLLLSATCRRMRAVSLPFIYTSRNLGLYQNTTAILSRNAIQKEHAIKDLLKASVRALEDAYFLLTRPDITSKFQSINVFNHWDITITFHHDDFPPSLFLPAISHTICAVLGHSMNLTNLSMFTFPLHSHIFQAIAALPHLRTFNLTSCPIESTITSPQLVQVRNLAVHIRDEESISTWETLALFPNAINVLFFHSSIFTMQLADAITLDRFSHLTHLCLGNLVETIFPDIVHFLHDTTEHHLTHLKLIFINPIDDASLFVLLNELQAHPMEILIIDGLLEGRPAIIRRISSCLPGLTALSLSRRESQRQRKTRFTCSWPLPPFEYAPYFSSFSKLRYFDWNYRMNRGVTSWTMLVIEGNDKCGPCGAPYELWESKDGDLDDNDSQHPLVSVFAAYSPSLETVTVGGGGGLPFASWGIVRGGDGTTISKVVPTSKLSGSARGIWNPNEWSRDIDSCTSCRYDKLCFADWDVKSGTNPLEQLRLIYTYAVISKTIMVLGYFPRTWAGVGREDRVHRGGTGIIYGREVADGDEIHDSE